MTRIVLWASLLAFATAAAASCSRQLLSVVADVPPPEPRGESTARPQAGPPGTLYLAFDTIRPAIEDVQDADSVIQLLPRDHAGNIDWVAALRSGLIAPRSSVSGIDLPPEVPRFAFGFDFYMAGPAPTFDAYFPHSAHTEWVDCAQCHARIFRYRGTDIKMADVLQGEYCGECHGKISFPPATACERCHRDMPQPANRAQPLLLGTLTLKRTLLPPEPVADAGAVAAQPADSTVIADTISVADSNAVAKAEPPGLPESMLVSTNLPNSVFPHWVHRIRYQCRVCHLDLFEPQLGANEITMQAIDEGQFCGRCHDGKTAFDVSFDSCQRCHQLPEEGE